MEFDLPEILHITGRCTRLFNIISNGEKSSEVSNIMAKNEGYCDKEFVQGEKKLDVRKAFGGKSNNANIISNVLIILSPQKGG